MVRSAIGVGGRTIVQLGEAMFELSHLIVNRLGRSCRSGLRFVVKAECTGRASVIVGVGCRRSRDTIIV